MSDRLEEIKARVEEFDRLDEVSDGDVRLLVGDNGWLVNEVTRLRRIETAARELLAYMSGTGLFPKHREALEAALAVPPSEVQT